MRFPGHRIAKHYFPVASRVKHPVAERLEHPPAWSLVGLDQVLVDMEVHASQEFVEQLGLVPGESVGLSDQQYAALIGRIRAEGCSYRFAPGGTVANTLNNYTFLSGEPAVLLGAMEQSISQGEPAWRYVADNPKGVVLDHVVPLPGVTGTALTFIDSAGERTFAVAPGVSTLYAAEHIPEQVVAGAAAVVVTLYTLGDPSWPIAGATLRLMQLANEAGVPVAFSLGTAGLVQRMRDEVVGILERYVTIAAMNNREAEALTGLDDPLLACQRVLDWVDLAIVTQGAEGMTIGGFVDEQHRRPTRNPLRSGAIPQYNRWEFSRLMRREDCSAPVRIYTQVSPYRGGPERLVNTSGAGDAALAAVLHDVAANKYHRATVPDSAKHRGGTPYLTYSSLSRNAHYGNRVAYEVLKGFSPRLDCAVGPDTLDPDAEAVPDPGEE